MLSEPKICCYECGDEHHPDEREEHEFRLNVRCCPACGAKRGRVIQDYNGPV